jgi:hypothetical protein
MGHPAMYKTPDRVIQQQTKVGGPLLDDPAIYKDLDWILQPQGF